MFFPYTCNGLDCAPIVARPLLKGRLRERDRDTGDKEVQVEFRY
jgi:hypothetical protein